MEEETMSETYSPNPEAGPDPSHITAFLSQRDLGLQIPINFVTAPGISITSACFPFGRYVDDAFSECFSNVLLMGYQRLVVDLYWNQNKAVWSFCPVGVSTSTSTTSATSASSTTSTSSTISTSSAASTPSTSERATSSIQARQATTNSPDSSVNTSPTSTMSDASETLNSLGSALPSVPVLPHSPDGPTYSIGPYTCTDTINLSALTSQLFDYIQKTQNNLDAHLIYLTINIHASLNASAPSSPAPVPSTLPDSGNLLGNMFTSNLSTYLYTPSELSSDRANLNGSWYEVPETYRPAEEYYSTSTNTEDIVSTEDGWPSEYFVEFMRRKRLILDFGSADPQMLNYSLSADGGTIFSSGSIHDNRSEVAFTQGIVESGCFSENNTNDLSQMNSSWATVPIADLGTDSANAPNSDLLPILGLGSNLTACGISPILNTTLLNDTADSGYLPYQDFSYSGIWSWAPGQPKNFTNGDANSDSLFRCATTSSFDPGGRWIVSDCSSKFYTACRADSQPYNWTISEYTVSYTFASRSCPNGYIFAAPRTALENSYLNQTIGRSNRNYNDHGPWIDLNSLDKKGCWASNNRPNATCPYDTSAREDTLRRQYVLVPSIAALIVLILTAISLCGKMAGNRNLRKRARRRVGDDVYEGVPS